MASSQVLRRPRPMTPKTNIVSCVTSKSLRVGKYSDRATLSFSRDASLLVWTRGRRANG